MRRNLTPEFSNRALYQDAGEAAAIQIYDGSLGGLIELFFGSANFSTVQYANLAWLQQ
jgi:hypothetical protein